MSKQKILILCDWFAPGFKAGGPIRSVVNMCLALENLFEIKVITTDTDLGERKAYDSVKRNEWNNFGKSTQIFYASSERLSIRFIRQLLSVEEPDVVYLNSMYSKYFTLIPLLLYRIHLLPNTKVILNPRGMLKINALGVKKNKKRIFLRFFKLLGLHKQLSFHFTDQVERDEALKLFGIDVSCHLSGNFPTINQNELVESHKNSGTLKLLFVGRIHPIKNLHYLLDCLGKVKHHVFLKVIGFLEDEKYWNDCEKIIDGLPSNIQVQYLGEVKYENVYRYSLESHFLALPTTGENFGHAIFDSLSAGRPVLISTKTPWRDLEQKKIGWDVEIRNDRHFIEKLDQAYEMSQEEYNIWSESAYNFARDYWKNSQLKEAYQKLFQK